MITQVVYKLTTKYPRILYPLYHVFQEFVGEANLANKVKQLDDEYSLKQHSIRKVGIKPFN